MQAVLADGQVRQFLPTQSPVRQGDRLVQAENFELERELDELIARGNGYRVACKAAEKAKNAAEQRIRLEQIQAVDQRIRNVKEELDALTVRAPWAGTWVSPNIDRMKDLYVREGETLGLVASLNEVIIRAVAQQEVPTDLMRAGAGAEVEVRVKGRPKPQFLARIKAILPAGHTRLPSQALGYAMGGSIRTATDDRRGIEAAKRFFEIHLSPDLSAEEAQLLSGQRVIVRFAMPERPWIFQIWRWVRQLVLRRFHK